jgi:putative phosphoesterase
MSENRVAAISDIHGNRWALEAVLEDIERKGIQRIVNLGDALYGPLDPAGTAEMLIELNLPTVRGNEDRIITESSDGDESTPTLRFSRDALLPPHLQWLESLPMILAEGDDLRLCHGTLERDDEYLLYDVRESGVHTRKISELAARLAALDRPVLLCGHEHLPRTVHLPNGALVVDPGSVGLPAYADDSPYPHVMEAGTPHARYAIVSRNAAGHDVDDVAVSYNWDRAAAVAQQNGRPDWAEWLRTGRARIP